MCKILVITFFLILIVVALKIAIEGWKEDYKNLQEWQKEQKFLKDWWDEGKWQRLKLILFFW